MREIAFDTDSDPIVFVLVLEESGQEKNGPLSTFFFSKDVLTLPGHSQ